MNKTTILIVGSVLLIAGVTGYYLYIYMLPDRIGVTEEDKKDFEKIELVKNEF
jgi:hypothetical protein